MKTFLLALLIVGQSLSATAQVEKYSRVAITADAASFSRMQAAGIALDHIHRHGNRIIAELSESEVRTIKNLGITYQTQIEDLQTYYADRAKNDLQQLKINAPEQNGCDQASPIDTVQVPSNFTLGTMGGFFKYNEMLAHLDMAALYPNLITIKQPIAGHQTIEGRPIYWVKLSDNPSQDESASEPQVLYDAVHHAREPMSMAQTIFYMYYLLENYDNNDLVKDIVDNTELFFVPCINPDGYIYNETFAPNGGGMWRKNRRVNANSTIGVDLNRNYGYNWGYNDLGSSPDPATEVYRGTGPFSEPETQAMKAFCEAHQFKNALNSHSFSNVLIHPFGYEFDVYAPGQDSARFVQWASLFTEYNRYGFGTTPQVLGYLGNGDSDAWMYGEQTTKPKIFSYTPETGSDDDGFWPVPSRIIPLAKGMFHTNLNMALVARERIRAVLPEKAIVQNTSASVDFTLYNLGLQGNGAVTATLQTSSPFVASVGNPLVFASLPDLVATPGSISFTLVSSVPQTTVISFELLVEQNGRSWTYPIERTYYSSPAVYSNSFNNLQNLTTGSWGLTTSEFHSPPTSITDSPNGDYPAQTSNTLVFNQVIDLSLAADAFVTFWAKWQIEKEWDYAQMKAVTTSGSTALCGRYTRTGAGFTQPTGEPVFDGNQLQWVEESMSLQDFIGEQIQLEMILVSDDFTEEDGMYIDDLEVHVLTITGLADDKSQIPFMLGNAYPNPALSSVSIAYEIPASTQNPALVITDMLGRPVQTIKLTETKGIAAIDVQNLPAGIYGYFLSTSHQQTAAKRMVVVK